MDAATLNIGASSFARDDMAKRRALAVKYLDRSWPNLRLDPRIAHRADLRAPGAPTSSPRGRARRSREAAPEPSSSAATASSTRSASAAWRACTSRAWTARAAFRSGSRSSASTRTSSRTISSSTCSSTRRASRPASTTPNVAQVFDLGKDDNTYWIAMEYLHGEPLREVMRRAEERRHAHPARARVRASAPTPPRVSTPRTSCAARTASCSASSTATSRRTTSSSPTTATPRSSTSASPRSADRLSSDPRGHAQGQARVHVARAGARRRGRSHDGHLRARRRALGAHDQPAPLPDGYRSRHAREGAGLHRPAARRRSCRGYPLELESVVMKALAKTQAGPLPRPRASSRARCSSFLMRRGVFVGPEEVAQFVTQRLRRPHPEARGAPRVGRGGHVDHQRRAGALARLDDGHGQRGAAQPRSGA